MSQGERTEGGRSDPADGRRGGHPTGGRRSGPTNGLRPVPTARPVLLAVLLALLLPAMACSGSGDATRVFGPFVAENVRPIEPDPIWFRWYEQTEECVGVDGQFARIEWFAAARIIDGDSETRHDAFFRPPNQIYLQGGRSADENTVRHEMVHELLDKVDPDHTHDNPAFVECVSELTRENGG